MCGAMIACGTRYSADSFYSPTSFQHEPYLISVNEDMMQELEITPTEAETQEFIDIFSGKTLIKGAFN
jgi:hypothetical protein